MKKIRDNREDDLSKRVYSDKKCRFCGHFMIRMKWNGRVDILVCDNTSCQMHRCPQGRIEIEASSRRLFGQC